MKYLVLALLAGCSSLVSDPCASGYHLDTGACMADQKTHGTMDPNGTMQGPDASVVVVHPPGDGATVAPQDAPVDAMVCPLPTTKCGDQCVSLDDDPYNCGHCGRTCSSGICAVGSCIGDLPGHIVVIGHDYVASDPAMDRVIANGVTLSVSGSFSGTVAQVGWWRGTAAQEAGIAAVTRGLAQTGHTAQAIAVATIDTAALANLDAIVVEPQVGDGDAAEAAGAAAAASLATYLAASHTVVVMETTAGVSYRWLHGAGLVDLVPPTDTSGAQVSVVAAGDAVVTGVVSPYLAKPGSVGFAGAAHAVVSDSGGDAVVIHATY
ncbi:MAG TPA: hypothetical protein VFQ65_25995 [Kofleriaceae bacterium]|nr:hypothetical protein [Kofleriaceae bacterium]